MDRATRHESDCADATSRMDIADLKGKLSCHDIKQFVGGVMNMRRGLLAGCEKLIDHAARPACLIAGSQDANGSNRLRIMLCLGGR
jgi:hypothetical protein